MGKVTIVTGPPCSGKTTFVAENRAPGDVVVDLDALAQAVGSPAGHLATGAQREVAFTMRRAAVEHVLSGTLDADGWIIHTQPSQAQAATYDLLGAETVALDPGMDVCLERAANRPDGTADTIRAWYAEQSRTRPRSAYES